MAESVKSALIGDPALWRLLEERGRAALRADEPARYAIVERSARLKLGVCERDPFESGERRTLNLGHTIGHALEIESPATGCRMAPRWRSGCERWPPSRPGAVPTRTSPPRLDALLDGLGFTLRRAFDADAVRAAMLGDKKRRAGRQRWILPMEIGQRRSRSTT